MPVDFHTHILPGIDDGSASVQESLEMLRMEYDQGIRCVVATPHFYAQTDHLERFLSRRNAAAQKLREAMAPEEILPEILIGAEVRFFYGISETDAVHELTIDGKRCILIEMPPLPWADKMYRELEQLYIRQNVIPVIAHIDRYIRPFQTRQWVTRLTELPVRIQANAGFFLNRSNAKLAMRMLGAGQIHLIGSDCHNLSSRTPNMGAAVNGIRRKLGQEAVAWICENEREILGAERCLQGKDWIEL